MPSVRETEQAISEMIAWVQDAGEFTYSTGFPYLWEREDAAVYHLRESPSGEYFLVLAFGVAVYVRPGNPETFGRNGRIEFLGTRDHRMTARNLTVRQPWKAIA